MGRFKSIFSWPVIGRRPRYGFYNPTDSFIQNVLMTNPKRFFTWERGTAQLTNGGSPTTAPGQAVNSWKCQVSGTYLNQNPTTFGTPTLGVDCVNLDTNIGVPNGMVQTQPTGMGPGLCAIIVAAKTTGSPDANGRLVSYSSGSDDYDKQNCFALLYRSSDVSLFWESSNHGALFCPLPSFDQFHIITIDVSPFTKADIKVDGLTYRGPATNMFLAITNHGIGFQATPVNNIDGYFFGKYKAYGLWTGLTPVQIASVTSMFQQRYGVADPIQNFINSLLAYAPDVLIIGDKVILGNTATVPSFVDSSGNNVTVTGIGTVPTFGLGALSGHNVFTLANTAGYFSFPFVTSDPKWAHVTVFNQLAANNAGTNNRLVNYGDSAQLNAETSGTTGFISTYLASGGLNTFVTPSTTAPSLGLGVAPDGWSIHSAWMTKPGNYFIKYILNAGVTTSVDTGGSTTSLTSATFGGLGGMGPGTGGGSVITGQIAFHMRWKTAPSDANMAAIHALVKAYYGL